MFDLLFPGKAVSKPQFFGVVYAVAVLPEDLKSLGFWSHKEG